MPDENYSGPDNFSYYTFDGLFESTTAMVTINVTEVNDRPVANAGSDRSNVLLGEPVYLDGSLSTDVDGPELNFQWMIVNRPPAV